MATRAGEARLHSLDMLRGVCAIGVAAYHLSSWSALSSEHPMHGVLAMFGTYGVSMFFILSGYSLAHAYGAAFDAHLNAARVGGYFRRRFARLAPLFGAVVLLSVAGRWLAGKPPEPFSLLANLSLGFGFYNPADTPVVGGWSIGVEVVFYVLFPVAVLLRRGALTIVLLAVFLTAWISHDLQRYPSLAQGWHNYVQPSNHWLFFCAGIYSRLFAPAPAATAPARKLMDNGVFRLVAIGGILAAMVVAGNGATELELVTGWRRAVLVVASIAIVAALATWQISGWAAYACTLLGGLSYPLYLLHPLIFLAAPRWAELGSWLALVGLFALALGLAVFVDRAIDNPMQRRLKASGW